MSHPNSRTTGEPLLTTSGIFVVQLRSVSNLGRRQLSGRIEHVMSGRSEPFVCLSDMLDFMGRHPLEPLAPVITMEPAQATIPVPSGIDQHDEDRRRKNNMANTKGALGAALMMLLLLPQLGVAATPAQMCAAAKNRAAASRTTAEARCYRKSLLTGLAVSPLCLSRAERTFSDAIAKAEAKGGCLRNGDSADIEAAVNSCVSSLDALTLAAGDCTPASSCLAGHTCISLTDNAAQNAFGLRMSQLTLVKPSALASGLLGATLTSALEISENACNLFGSGTFNWLLDFDQAAHTLQTGGAAPVSDPSQGYMFESGIAFGSSVAPATAALSLAGNGAFSTTAVDVTLPVYLDASGSSGFILPLNALSFSGQLSSDHNCVGSYNAAGLVPPACSPDASHPTFLNGGTAHAFVTLENADAVIIAPINESLCVLLSGDAAQYGDGGNPTRCKRSSGAIVFSGDSCSSTGAPGGCADAMELAGSFAASAVTIH